jgi:hypothetical protein
MGFWENFKIIGSKVFQFFIPLIQRFLQEGGPIILEMAFKYVPQIAASMSDKDGESKRKEVIRLMMEEAKLRGITLSMSLVNAAIELAVAKLKV